MGVMCLPRPWIFLAPYFAIFTGKYWNIVPNPDYTKAWISHPRKGLVGVPTQGWEYADDDNAKEWLKDEQLTVREIEVEELKQEVLKLVGQHAY